MSEYTMRKLPHPGQSIPNKALVGHTGSGPFGVVGSPAQMAAHISVVDAATTSGAPRFACAAPQRVTMIRGLEHRGECRVGVRVKRTDRHQNAVDDAYDDADYG